MSVAASEFLMRITYFQTHTRFLADALYASILVRLSLSGTVYLEVAVSHTKQFFGKKRAQTKKNSHFEGDCTWTARSIGKLMVFIQDLAVKSICEACEKRGC